MDIGRMSVVAVGLISADETGKAADAEKALAAISAAEKWLSLLDEGKYGKSWKEASRHFKKTVELERYEQIMHAARKPLGNLVSRKVLSTTHRTDLPGAPDGEYIVIEISTSFENKKSATETVTPMMEKGQKWRVSGYYLK